MYKANKHIFPKYFTCFFPLFFIALDSPCDMMALQTCMMPVSQINSVCRVSFTVKKLKIDITVSTKMVFTVFIFSKKDTEMVSGNTLLAFPYTNHERFFRPRAQNANSYTSILILFPVFE